MGLDCILLNDESSQVDPLVPAVESVVRYELEYSGDSGRYMMVEIGRGDPLVVSIAYVTGFPVNDEKLAQEVRSMVSSVEGMSTENVVIVNGRIHGTVTI